MASASLSSRGVMPVSRLHALIICSLLARPLPQKNALIVCGLNASSGSFRWAANS